MFQAVLVAALLLAGPAPKLQSPHAVIADLYVQQQHNKGPFFQTKSRALADHWFEPHLAALIWSDAVWADGEAGAIDFDPLYGAQDTEITHFVVHPAVLMDMTSTVLVTFDNFKKHDRVTWSLVLRDGRWKISDIAYSDGFTMRGLLEASEKMRAKQKKP